MQGIYYYHPDHLGSANWITDLDERPVEYIHYMPYGELWHKQQETAYDERYKFTGKERDTETEYDYFGARYYASALPTWLSVDPLSDKYPSISPYAYCNWNPVKYVDPDGRDAYVFDENGKFLQKNIEDGQHYGVVLKDGQELFKFEFADPINDPAIIGKEIKYVLFVTDEQISQILTESGVNNPQNQKNKYFYTLNESNANNIRGDGKMDYVATGMYNGAKISVYDNALFITNTKGRKVAHNTYNFGNFLWGAGTATLGMPYIVIKIGSNLNNYLNDLDSNGNWDSTDDQFSIKMGFLWQKQHK